MGAVNPSRREELERHERDSFVLLQHLYTVSEGDPATRLSGLRIAEDLHFTWSEASLLVEHLVQVGYILESAPGSTLAITSAGVDYIERLAWRRRSVRRDHRPGQE